MGKTYLEIRDLLKENGLGCSISLDVVSCIMASVDASGHEVTDKEFETLCNYTRYIWDKTGNSCFTQMIADVVVDCIWHCFDYYQCRNINLTFEDMEQCGLVYEEVIDAFLNRYYDV